MTGINAEKIATFLDVSEKVLSLICFPNDPYIHFRRRWTQVLLREFETHQNVSIRVKRNAELFL